jgi:hypothetical protein
MLDQTTDLNPERTEFKSLAATNGRPGTPRQLLKAGIASRETASAETQSAQRALSRAEQSVVEAEIHARELVEAQHAFVAAQEDATRAGRKAPAVPANHSARRAAASEKIAVAVSIRNKFAGELDIARTRLAATEHLVADLALPVLLGEADKVAEKLLDAHQEVFRLSAEVRSAAMVWLPSTSNGGALRPIPSTAKMRAALDPKEPTYVVGPTHPETVATERWRSFYARLLTDPDATLNEGE